MRLPEPALGPDHPVNRLREASAVLEAACDALPAHQRDPVAWLLMALSRYDAEAAAGLGLDQALGLRPRAGGDPWWQLEDLAVRDRMLREIAACHYGDLDATRTATAMLCDLAKLRRQNEPAPGSACADLARAQRHAPIPSTVRRLRDILTEANHRN